MRIVVDAMGTDNRPAPDIEGAVLAARELKETIVLVGDRARMEAELGKHATTGLMIELVHAEEQVAMTDTPSKVMKSKPGSSMHVGMNLVRDASADAFVTMGNTGAAHAIATLSTLRRIPGVKRPALTAIYPVLGRETIFLDIGANADSRALWLVQYAVMGSIYAQRALNRDNPRVGTLSNGEEEGKGNELVKEVQVLLQQSHLNYVGHVEPKEILQGSVDVVVVDGFVGNIFLKTFEATLRYFTEMLRNELRGNVLSAAGGLLSRGAFGRVRKRIDPGEVGGAPLLGVNGVVIIGHGSSDAHSVKNAIKQAQRAVHGNTVEAIRRGLAQLET